MRPAAATALLGLVLALTAAVFDAEPLYVPGAAFILLAAGAVAWVLAGSRGVLISRTVSARRVVEEHSVEIVIDVRSGSLALPAGLIEDPLLPNPAPIAAGRRHARVHIDARFARRGRKRLVEPSVIIRDPFGLATRVVQGGGAAEVLVLPRVERVVTPPGEGDGTGLAARRGRPSVAAEVDLDGLRPHRAGAPASRMYWPALARTGELMERRMRADSDTRPLVVLDPRSAPGDGALDAAVRAAASLCVHLARQGGCALLLPGDRRPTVLEPTLAAWEHAHARLAVVTGVSGPNLAGLASRRGPVFYVAAYVPARPPRALTHAPGGGRILVVPGALPGRRAVFSVAGCTAYELSGQHAVAGVA
ncbi:MAG TPA: DUF58 domain-containing protein [Solirubrobacteraceae bacterium]|nr:DUF58 domain-containing protein [Solirubrobacteraceae bacterium]